MQVEVAPIDLRDYAISLGWTLVPEAVRDGLYVLNSPWDDYQQLIFPKDLADGYNERINLVIEKLAKTTNKSGFQVVEEIREVNDDVISLRYFSDSKAINSLSFEGALEAIEGTKQLILSAASSVIHPATYHPRLSRVEPNELLKKTRFRHTQEGSFILKVSCPIDVGNPVTDLFGVNYNEPFARRTFALMNEASYGLLNAIESNAEEQFLQEIAESSTPQLSYNFCDALLDLYDDERELPFELRFNWSRNSKKLPIPQVLPTVRFLYELKPKLEAVKDFLKPQDSTQEDTFIGTVESLSGNIDRSGNRSGEVKISLLLGSDLVNAKVNLRPDDYVKADEAHMTPGAYVKIKGKLQPGKNLRTITDVTEFGIV